MIKKALLMDGKQFAKNKQIRAKRPSEYWLLFLKHHVISVKESWFHFYYLVFLIPVIIFLFIIFTEIGLQYIVPIIIGSFVLSLSVFSYFNIYRNNAYVPVSAYNELAKFIISIKGDVYRNLIGLRINAGVIESKKNAIYPKRLGLKYINGVKYKPFEIERFKANFTLKDGSVCVVSMHQIVLRVITTKRRSSGKTKTKMKRKHKFFYQLTLKLKKSDYKIISPNALLHLPGNDKLFEVVIKNDEDFCWVKIKTKKKLYKAESQMKYLSKIDDSIFTQMMKHLINNKIIENRGASQFIKKLN